MYLFIPFKYIKKIGEKIYNFLFEKCKFNKTNFYHLIILLSAIVTIWIAFSKVSSISDSLNVIESNTKYNYNDIYNKQKVNTANMDGKELIEKFYSYLNSKQFENACSLLSNYKCYLNNIIEFTDWVEGKRRKWFIEYKDGVKLIDVKGPVKEYKNTNQQIYCVKREFTRNSSDKTISQIRQYSIINRPNSKTKEIGRMLCEKAYKEGSGDRTHSMCNGGVDNPLCLDEFK